MLTYAYADRWWKKKSEDDSLWERVLRRQRLDKEERDRYSVYLLY